MDKVTYRTQKSDLVKVGLPEQTTTYKPISHEELIDLTLNSIQGAGFELQNEWYESAREGQIATGHYAIKNIADDQMQLRIAWQNSYNKQVSLKFALGLHVFVCSNGAVSGDMGAFRKKHTGDIQNFTPKTIEEYIRTAGEAFSQMQKQRDAMKEIILDTRMKGELLGRMYIEQDFIESTQMNIIKREIAKPTYDYGALNSLWEMYQFTTFSMKDVHPSLWMKNHLAANSFFIGESGLLISKSSVSMNVEEVSANQVSMFEVTGFVESTDPTDVEAEVTEIIKDEIPETVIEPLVVEERLDVKDVSDNVRQYPLTSEEVVETTLDQTYVAQLSKDPKEGSVTSPEVISSGIEIETPQDDTSDEPVIGVKNKDYSEFD